MMVAYRESFSLYAFPSSSEHLSWLQSGVTKPRFSASVA